MRFGTENYINGFWVVLLLLLFFLWVKKRKAMALATFANKEILKTIASQVNFRAQTWKFILLIAAISLSVIALMRPQLGFKWQEVKRRGLDILIAIDTSKSMLASDVKPNRLERSRLACKDLIPKLKGDRIGLIAFSGTAFLQCPLTVDYSGFLLALDDLNPGIIPYGGTSISGAIKEALEVFQDGDKKYKVLVIITDGEDHEGSITELAQKAAKQGMRIYCIGIGTQEGELIQVTDEKGGKVFLKDREGNVVKSRLNEKLLQDIALTTGGTYVRSSGADLGLDLIYEEKLSKLEKREIKAEMSKLYNERFQIPLTLALLLIIAEPFISDRKKT